ncbi:MAG: GGDEF domain-containing protein [Parvularculaceae bacterium]
MKISDVSKAPRTGAVGKTKKAAAAAAPPEATPVDAVVIAGIPDNELTPRVRQALQSLMEEVATLRAELAQTRARIGELEELADTDPLVGVLNRRAFVRELNRALAMVERYGAPSSLVFIDLNDLKTINDNWGHAAGDAALAHVAKILAAHVRQTDAVGRLGGDEFGIILTQADQATAEEKAKSLAALVEAEDVQWRDQTFTARLSCGVVEIKKGSSADEALETADNEMYRVKKGR